MVSVRIPFGTTIVTVFAMLAVFGKTSVALVPRSAYLPARSSLVVLRGGSSSAVAEATETSQSATAELYQELLAKLETITHLGECLGLLPFAMQVPTLFNSQNGRNFWIFHYS